MSYATDMSILRRVSASYNAAEDATWASAEEGIHPP